MSKTKGTTPKTVRTNWECRVDRQFLEDLTWFVSNTAKTAEKLLDLMDHVIREPEHGIGKPERLKHLGANIWSRRVTGEHRMVYFVGNGFVTFLMGRYHY